MIAVLLFAVVTIGLPTALAHGTTAKGLARCDGDLHRIEIQNPPDEFSNLTFFHVVLTDLDGTELVDVTFDGTDNWVDHPGLTFVNPDYHGESVDPDVNFTIDGAQVSNTLQAEGTFQGCSFRVAPAPLL